MAPAARPTGESGFAPARLVEGPELQELARAAGVSIDALPRGASFFLTSPPSNSVVQTNDLTSVTPGVGGSAHRELSSSRMNDDGTMTLEGSEFIRGIAYPPAIGGASSSIPAGGFLALVPANPRFIDGTRIATFLSNFDQFCLEDVTYEYVAGPSFTTPGQLLLAYINDVNDPIVEESGVGVVRNAYTRAGACMFSVTKNAHIKLGRPLLKWFYTASEADPSFEMPGMVALINLLDTTTTTDASVPLGSLVMHYRIRVRAPAFQAGNYQTYDGTSASLDMTAATITAAATVKIAGVSSGLAASAMFENAVYWGVIASCSDPGGVNTWRTWRHPRTNEARVFSNGEILIWRYHSSDASVHFYPTWSDAISSFTNGNDGVDYAYIASSTVAAGGTKGFKLWNIAGTDMFARNQY